MANVKHHYVTVINKFYRLYAQSDVFGLQRHKNSTLHEISQQGNTFDYILLIYFNFYNI